MLQARVLNRTDEIDREAFLYLVQPVLPSALRLAHGMLRSPTEAEDVVQEATLKAWSKISTFHAGTDFKAWFLKIVANECRQTMRSGWWKVARESSVDRGSTRSPQDQFVADDAVRRALSKLNYNHRAVIVLRYYMDLSFDQIGTTLGISPRTAKSRTHRVAHPPTVETVPSYLGSKQLLSGPDLTITGGCIGTSADGLHWECYLGDAAVQHGILVKSLLGQPMTGPSHG